MISDKKLAKIEKALGKETVDSLGAGQPDELKITIVKAEQAMKEAKEELEANTKYQEIKEGLKALSEGMKEVNKRQRAVIEYCLHLLEEKGEA